MPIALLSDTHDNVATTAAALALLRQRGATYYVHCGDVGSGRILDLLAGLPAGFVWGNCDWDRGGLQSYAQKLGIECFGGLGHIMADGKRIAIMHGDDHRLRQTILEHQEHDYLFQGHTHVRADLRIGKTRLINPGALHRCPTKSVALLDPATDQLEFLCLPAIT